MIMSKSFLMQYFINTGALLSFKIFILMDTSEVDNNKEFMLQGKEGENMKWSLGSDKIGKKKERVTQESKKGLINCFTILNLNLGLLEKRFYL